MARLNRDAIVAILLLVACGVFFWATFDIRQPNYGVLMPSAWPRVVLGAMTLLSFIYLFQSLRAGPNQPDADQASDREPGLRGFLSYWRNPIICFAMFFAFLITLPVLGMLIGGVSFVFLLMNFLGGWAPRQVAVHAVVSLITIGLMWSLFTFVLGVMLPTGEIYNPFGI